MSRKVSEEMLPRLRQRYAGRGREGRSPLIVEVCEQWGCSRKHAIKLLGAKAGWGGDPAVRKGRPPTYGPGVVEVLWRIWPVAEQPCGNADHCADLAGAIHFHNEPSDWKQCSHHGELPEFYADIEHEHALCERIGWQFEFTEFFGEAESVDEPERERHHKAMAWLPVNEVSNGNVNDGCRDCGFDELVGEGDHFHRRERERDAVRDGE